jgi:hypothetical protein
MELVVGAQPEMANVAARAAIRKRRFKSPYFMPTIHPSGKSAGIQFRASARTSDQGGLRRASHEAIDPEAVQEMLVTLKAATS